MTTVLKVATPEGESGRILTSSGDYLFRYNEDAKAQVAISLLMPVRLDEYLQRVLHPIFQMSLPEGYVLEQLRTANPRCWGSADSNRGAKDYELPRIAANPVKSCAA
jgi:HipA-like protein